MKLESEVQQTIQIEAAKYDCVLMRNNVGAFTDSTGRTVFYGLGNISSKQNANIKSSDLIGITEILITPDMVGKKIGVFTAIECKREDWNPKNLNKRETAQKNFIDWIVSKSGLAGFAKNVDDMRKIIRK